MQVAVTPPLIETRPASDRDELAALLKLAGPLVGANLLQMAVYAIDVVFVARLGTVEFAAATLGVFLYSLVMWALMSMATACAPIIAAELGRRRHSVREVRRSFRMALWLAGFSALPFGAMLMAGEPILLAAGQDPRVAARAGDFLVIIVWALPASLFAAVMRTVAATLGRPGWAMGVTAMAVGLALVANWALVFGNLGFPALGLEGSAWASVIVSVAMMLAYFAILLLDPVLRRWRLFGRWWRTEWPRMIEILRLGIPISLAVTMESALFGGASVLMGLIGVAEVAAHAIALNIAALAFQVPLGVSQASTIRVGMGYGAKDPAWVARAGRVALIVGIGFMVVTAALMWAIPRTLIGIYIDVDVASEAAVVALATRLLMVGAVFQLVDGAQAVAAGVLRGLQDTRVPMLIALFGYWVVGFGASVLFGFFTGGGAVGIWIGLAIGLLVVSALLLWRWRARERLGLVPRTT